MQKYWIVIICLIFQSGFLWVNTLEAASAESEATPAKTSQLSSKKPIKKIVKAPAESLNLALAFSDAWTFTVLKDKPQEKKILFYPKSQTVRKSSARVEERRFMRPAHFKIDRLMEQLSNSPVESECRPVEAGQIKTPVLEEANKKYDRRYLGLRCRREKLIKVIQVFDTGSDIYVLTFWKNQSNWADQQFRAMNSYLFNRAHICPSSQANQCNEEIHRRMKPFEFDNIGGKASQWPGKKMPKMAYIL